MKKPVSVKVGLFLLWFQVALTAFMCWVAVLANAAPASSGFWFGMEDSMARQTGAHSLAEFDSEHLGEFMGKYFFLLLPVIVTIFFISKRRANAILVCLVVSIVIVIANGGVPILAIICLILTNLRSARNYFKSSSNPPPISS
jgi:hypothetical protein